MTTSGSPSRTNARRLRALGLAVLAAPLVAPMLRPGWLQSHEGLAYPIRLAQLRRCWDDGFWSARWFPDLNQGGGYPFLSFYAPGYYVLAGAAQLAGAPLALALKVPTVVAALAGAAGAYRLARLATGPVGGFVAAALFAYAPYVVRDVYIRGDLAEHLALAFLPWCLFAVLRLGRKRRPRDVVLAAATGAVPILTHNISGLFSGALMIVAALAAARASPAPRRTVAAAAAAGAGALLLSAFFWVPAMSERRCVRIEEMTVGPYAAASNFLPPAALLGPPLVPGVSQELPMSFEPSYVALAALVAALAGRRRSALPRGPVVAVALVAIGVGLAMTTRLGEPVYRLVPLLRFVQFPWRFLGPVALGLAVAGGAAVEALLRGARPRVRGVAGAVACAAAVAAVAPILGPKRNVPIPDWAIDPERLARRRETATGVGEYLPVWAEEAAKPRDFPDGVQVIGDGTASAVRRGVGRYDFVVEARDSVTVVLLDVWYPGWEARVNGEPAATSPRARTGNVELAVGAGRHEVRARLNPTPLRRATRAVSLAAALGGLGIVLAPALRGVGRPRRRGADPADP
jgi:hypothetical protein